MAAFEYLAEEATNGIVPPTPEVVLFPLAAVTVYEGHLSYSPFSQPIQFGNFSQGGPNPLRRRSISRRNSWNATSNE